MIFIILGIIAILLLVIIIALFSDKRDKNDYYNASNEEKSNFNKSDINMMNNLNNHGFTAKKVNSSKIEIPDFDKSKPIGYIDKNNSSNTYGDKISNNNFK